MKELCRINFNLYLAAAVLASNAIKLVIITFIAVRLSPDRLLVLGDAIQSFLSHPDPHSRSSCLAAANPVIDATKLNNGTWVGVRRFDSFQKRQWMSSIYLTRWVMGLCL